MNEDDSLQHAMKLMRSFLDGRIDELQFVEEYLKVWKYRRDTVYARKAEWDEPYDELLISQLQQGKLTKYEFDLAWNKLWKITTSQAAINLELDSVFSACDSLNHPAENVRITLSELREIVRRSLEVFESPPRD